MWYKRPGKILAGLAWLSWFVLSWLMVFGVLQPDVVRLGMWVVFAVTGTFAAAWGKPVEAQDDDGLRG